MKTIVITGGSSGIGLAAGKMFASKGEKVVLVSRNATKISLSGLDNIFTYDADLTIEQETKDVLDKIILEQGFPDIVVNNAGAGIIKLLEDTSLEEWNAMFLVNLTSMFLVTREFMRKKEKDRFLHFINVSSEAGIEGFATYSAYCAAKFGVTGFSKSLQQELASKNTKVDILCPGDVATPFMDKCPIDSKLMQQYGIEVLSKEDMLSAEVVAQQIVFLSQLPKNCVLGDVVIVPTKKFV